MSVSEKSLPIVQLLLDCENPRFSTVKKTDEEAFSAILNKWGDNIVNLSIDIAKIGLMPSDFLYVTPHGQEKYIVLDGNRRLAALRILSRPSLLKGTSLERRINDVQSAVNKPNNNIPNEVMCCVFETRDDAAIPIQKRHSGSDEGRGPVSWGAEEKERFRQRQNGQKTPKIHLLLLDFLRENRVPVPENFAITNLERLLSSPEVCKALGLNRKAVPLTCSSKKTEFIHVMDEIIKKLSSKGSVHEVYHKSDRLKFIKEFDLSRLGTVPEWIVDVKARPLAQELPQETETKERKSVPASSQTSETNSKKTSKVSYSSDERKFLIPQTFKLPPTVPVKLLNLVKEMKSLDVEKYVNTVGVLFRVLIELMVTLYLKKNEETSRKKKIDYDSRTLVQKISSTKDLLVEHDIFSDKELFAITQAVTCPGSPTSTASFNAYVHDPFLQPSAFELKVGWDNWQRFLKALSENL